MVEITDYVPRSAPAQESPALAKWAEGEFTNIARVFQGQHIVKLRKINVAPPKPRDGMVAYADGTNWNPGSGEGFYGRYGSAWNKFLTGGSVPVGANPTGTVGLSTVNGSAATFLRSDGAPPLSQAIAPSWTGKHIWKNGSGNLAVLEVSGSANVLTITPQGSTQGIVVTQTLTGSPATLDGTIQCIVTDTASTQNQGAIAGVLQAGASAGGQKNGILASLELTGDVGSTAALVALQANCYTNVAQSNSPTLWGYNSLVFNRASASGVSALLGAEINLFSHTSAAVAHRIGWSVVASPDPLDSTGSANIGAQGTSTDCAYLISSFDGGGGRDGNRWKIGLLASAVHGKYPFDSGSTFIQAAAGTMGYGIDLSAATISNYAYKSPGFSVDGSGNVVGNAFDSTTVYKVAGTQIFQGRETGWTQMTGTATKGGGFDTSSVTLPQLAQVVKAIVDASFAHGWIGT